jgi:hypothetical protein
MVEIYETKKLLVLLGVKMLLWIYKKKIILDISSKSIGVIRCQKFAVKYFSKEKQIQQK